MKLKTLTQLMCTLGFLLFTTAIFAQSTITGKITDEAGEALFGATVQVKGTSNGVTADADGMYSIQAKEGDVLIFSFLGYSTQQVSVGSTTTIDVQMKESGLLDEVVVSSSRKPIRKLQATTAINSVGAQEFETIRPETFSEAIQNTPGITTDESQGRKGGFNIRGFPGGNFLTTLIDGMPVSGIAGFSGGVQEFFGFDPNVERIEVVRGAAATLFGRSSAAGAINIISRTGGTEHKGSFSLTNYSNTSDSEHKFSGAFNYRADINFNGPISDKVRYNIGGYILNDAGQKEQANRDKGVQLRANLDWLVSDKSKVRVYFGTFNNEFQNVVDGVWDMENDRIADGWGTHNTFYNDPVASGLTELGVRTAFFNTTPAVDADTGRPFTWNPAESVESTKGTNIGFDATFHLGNEWYVNGKVKYNNFFLQDINELGLTTIFEASSTIQRLNANALNQTRDLLTEARIQKVLKGSNSEHNLTAGIYYSDAERDRLGFNYFYGSDVSTRPTFTPLFGLSTGSFAFPPTLPPTVYLSNTSSNRTETATGIFVGDEMVFNEKLSVNVAWRYDWQKGTFNNNPEKIRETGTDWDPATTEEVEIDLEDYSFSIGANYLIGENSAAYANFNRSFTFASVANLGAEVLDNESVQNFEVGYRAGLGDITIDATYFNTTIDNSISTIFDNDTGGFEDRPAGSYSISGAEIALAYAPKAIKGLLLRGGVTLQKSEYDDFIEGLAGATVTAINDNGNPLNLNLVTGGGETALNLAGNQVRAQPKTILNLNLGYASKTWGLDFGGFTYSGIYYDAANIYDEQSLSVYNAGGYYAFPMGKNKFKISVRVKNIFDGEKAQNLFTGGGLDEVIQARIADANYTDQLGFAVLQNPRRTLVTLAYQF